MNVNDIYTPLQEAKAELERRWGDKELKKKVEEYWNGELPPVFNDGSRAILARGVLTPNFETKYFLDIIDIIDLNPVCGEFHNDRFCTMNKDKIHLGKLVFYHGVNEKNENKISKKNIIDLQLNENKSFKDIKTLHGQSFIEFHHNLYRKQYNKILDTFDISSFKQNDETAKEVYEKIFSLCIVNSILFENFIGKETEHEKKFTENVVTQAFESVYKKFNIKPLVVPLLPLKNEEKELWDWYPGHIKKIVEDIFNDN